MKKLVPFYTRVIVKLNPPEDKIYGEAGLIIPTEKNAEHLDTGIIVAMGPLAFNDMRNDDGSSPVKIGDTVAFRRYEGLLIRDPDNVKDAYRVLNDIEIWAGVE